MATMPICGICGGRGWGHICAGAVSPQMLARATGAAMIEVLYPLPLAKLTKPVSGFAPLGQCAHCDAARVAAAERQLMHRKRRKETP
jgi:hypothetical protein